ncbi:MAG: DeoR/GlpR transcriptional regulator [Alphaproteobacteria bacterium]|nr:DeoR/GlpR transcriptional regulator [Alphaproteobacteria bacterium]
MTALNLRQQYIANVAREKGFVTIDGLAEALEVTPQTVRRDISFLCEHGILARFHGGAVFRSSVTNMSYETRAGSMTEEKAALAARVAAEIPDRSSIFIDIGTTAEAVAEALRTRSNLRIVTNNLNVVRLLAAKDDFEITVTGGIVRNRDLAVSGATATAFVERFRLDYSILGVVAIDASGAILDFHADEEALTQAIIGCGRQSFVVADSSKFGRNAIARVARLSQASALFTNAVPEGPWGKMIRDSGVRLVLPDDPLRDVDVRL